jgi:hypothetical protein
MKKLFKSFTALVAIVAVLSLAPAAFAADLTYTALPGTGDSELVLQHKNLVASASNKYSNVTTATTTVVKSGSGILERIIINTGASTSTITVYDNTAGSGTKIATAATTAQGVLIYGCRFGTGLTVITSSTADITVVYR